MAPFSNLRRRVVIAIAGSLLAAGLWPVTAGRAHAQTRKPVVDVFLQLDVKAIAVERALQERLPDLAITVFGRFPDFQDVLISAPPDAILCIAPVLAYQGDSVTLQGMRGGRSVEAYVLASAGKPLGGSLAGKTIGVVDLMGRGGTQSFLNHLLHTNGILMKRVSKIEDLLALLEFSAADGVVLSSSAVQGLTARTRLSIKTTDLPDGLVGLPAVAVLNGAVAGVIIRSFQALDADTNRMLGVDSWSAP
jgi:hypothetical protein